MRSREFPDPWGLTPLQRARSHARWGSTPRSAYFRKSSRIVRVVAGPTRSPSSGHPPRGSDRRPLRPVADIRPPLPPSACARPGPPAPDPVRRPLPTRLATPPDARPPLRTLADPSGRSPTRRRARPTPATLTLPLRCSPLPGGARPSPAALARPRWRSPVPFRAHQRLTVAVTGSTLAALIKWTSRGSSPGGEALVSRVPASPRPRVPGSASTAVARRSPGRRSGTVSIRSPSRAVERHRPPSSRHGEPRARSLRATSVAPAGAPCRRPACRPVPAGALGAG